SRGHTFIDFGGQYLLGRMLVRGQGRHLYHRPSQRGILEEAYPLQSQSPKQETSDADRLMISFMGNDDETESKSVGGPLYPRFQAGLGGGFFPDSSLDRTLAICLGDVSFRICANDSYSASGRLAKLAGLAADHSRSDAGMSNR